MDPDGRRGLEADEVEGRGREGGRDGSGGGLRCSSSFLDDRREGGREGDEEGGVGGE